MPGVDQVYLPGEIEAARQRKHETEGITIPEGIWGELVETARGLGVAVPTV